MSRDVKGTADLLAGQFLLFVLVRCLLGRFRVFRLFFQFHVYCCFFSHENLGRILLLSMLNAPVIARNEDAASFALVSGADALVPLTRDDCNRRMVFRVSAYPL